MCESNISLEVEFSKCSVVGSDWSRRQ